MNLGEIKSIKSAFVIIMSCAFLIFTNGCKPSDKISNEELLKNKDKYQIKNFLVMNKTNDNNIKFIEAEIKNDKSKILNCNIKSNQEAICAANIIDLNNDTIPEIIFENQPAYTKQGGIIILSKIRNRWELYPLISDGLNFFGKPSNARFNFYKGNVSSIKPLWKNIKYEDYILSAEYGGEPPPPIESFNIFSQLFGLFPAYYRTKEIGKFYPNSLQIISGNKAIPPEIYEQKFEYIANASPSCLDTRPTKFICYAIFIDLNEDGVDEILYQDSDHKLKTLYNTSNKWEIIVYNSPYRWNFNPDIKKLASNPNLIKLEKPIFNDFQIGKYTFRPSQLPCTEIKESGLCFE